MKDKFPHWREMVLLLLGWAVYFLIKYGGPLWVNHLFALNSFDLLNRFAENSTLESLDFYQGRIQEVLWGPATQTISFLLLAFILCRYFRDTSLKVFAAIIFLFLVVTKCEILFWPPYGDAIGGPFVEGWWLYKHNFDYAALFQQPNFSVGGPRVYFFSIYPGFLALTLKLIPATKIFLAFHHLFTFALTAAIVAMLRECGRANKILDPILAIFSALILLALPLFQSQTEAINMEIPVAFFTLWSAYAFIHKRWTVGAICACLAALTKGIGVIACGGAVVILFWQLWQSPSLKEKIKLAGLALLSAVTGIFIVGAKFFFRDTHVQQGLVKWDAGWPSLRNEFILYLFLIALAIFIFKAVGQILRREKDNLLAPVVMSLFAGGWYLLFFNFYAVSPRYRVTLYPFLIFLVVYSVHSVLIWKTPKRILACVVLVAACLLSYGRFYGTMFENDHVLLERSLEYRNDLMLNRRLVKAAEERYSNHLIVAPFTIAQALAIPELGYVHKKLNVMVYGFGLKYGDIANYKGLKKLDLARTVFVGVRVAPIDADFMYPVGRRDIILEELVVGNKKGSFFMGGYAVEALWRVVHGMDVKK